MKKRTILFSLLLLLTADYAGAQSVEWAYGFGASEVDIGYSVFADDSGFVYTTGSFKGTVDFDPGPGTHILTSPGIDNMFISKLDAAGNLVWAKHIGSASGSVARAITVDKAGNVYTTGNFSGTTDFDPGPGVFNMSAAGYAFCFISKLDASGNFVWAKSFSGNSEGKSISTDTAGNAYITGEFQSTVDFDPGPGTYNLTALGQYDVFVAKLNVSGNFVWAKHFGGTYCCDIGRSIALDDSGYVYTTGNFGGTVDFDPGSGTYNLTSATAGANMFVSKLDASGNFVWAKAVVGTSLIVGDAITTHTDGSIYTTGYFWGTADFDPDTSSYILSVGAANSHAFVSKWDAAGNFVWANQLGSGQQFECRGHGIATDAAGNIFTTGYFTGTVDFDPGPGAYNLTAAGYFDIYISKLNSSGDFAWTIQFGGSSNIPDASTSDWGRSIAVNKFGEIYSTGNFVDSTGFNPGGNGVTITSSGETDIYIVKITDCSPSASTETVSACGSYPWNGNTYYTSGTYSDTLLNASGCDSILTLHLTVNEIFSSSDTVSTCGSFVWNGNTYTTSGTYTANLQSAAGCDSTLTLQLTINSADTSVAVSNNMLTAEATSATFQWLDCDNNFSPITNANDASFTATATGNYAVAVTQNSCTDTSACFNVTVTGLQGNIATNVLSVFPNPSNNGLFTINCREWRNTIYEVKDVTGRIITTGTLTAQQTTLDLTRAESGIYFLSVHGQTTLIINQK